MDDDLAIMAERIHAEQKRVLDSLEKTFGYRPDMMHGEKWVVYDFDKLIVVHPERKPRIFTPGCGGSYVEIDPHFDRR